MDILLFIHSFIILFRLSPAGLPTSDISTKRVKLAEEETSEKGEEEKSAEEKVWPEPPQRVSPPVRAALVLPNGVTCPDGCKRFSSSEDPDPVTVSRLRYAAVTQGEFIIEGLKSAEFN